jgi:hypothetical protein
MTATIVKVHTNPGVLYGLEVILGIGTGAYSQAAFAVIQAVLEPKEAFNGLTMMLLGERSLTFGIKTSCR